MIVKPFRPYIFREDLKNVTAPPFDVVTKEQEAALKKNTYNIVHLTLPGESENPRDTLSQWIKDGALQEVPDESMIVITQDFRGNGKDFCRIGLITPVETSPAEGIVLPHERTFDWAVDDRKKLMAATGCQLEPIFLAVSGASFERVLRSSIRDRDPVRIFQEPAGVINRFYLISDPESVNTIRETVGKEKGIVADGHHRLQATRRMFAESEGKAKDFWKYNLAYVTSLQEESLLISGIHRMMSTEFSFARYRKAIESYFDIIEDGKKEDSEFIRIYDGSYHTLKPREVAFEAIGEFGTFRYEADPSLVNTLLFEKIMEMSNHDIAKKVSYTHSVPVAVEDVDKGKFGFAVLMPQWDKGLFLSMTEKGRMFPQKSTYFYPKVPSGIAVYCNDQ